MHRLLVFATLALALVPAHAGEGPAPAPPEVAFPLDVAIIDPDAKDELPPYLIMFDGGKDQRGRDVRRPLGRLEGLRGPSKMFPESNKDDGLPVVLRGIRIHRNLAADGKLAGYEVELQGEFNMVKAQVSLEEVAKFLAGKTATFALKGEKNYGVYSYVSTTKMTLQMIGDEVVIHSLVGDFTFREGFRTYTSDTKKLSPPAGRNHLYRGQRSELPALPSI